MPSVNDIIENSRGFLSDPTGDRWNDLLMSSLVREGLYEIQRSSDLMQDDLYIELVPNKSSYDLSVVINRIIAAYYKNYPLKLLTSKQIQEINPLWQTNTSTEIEALIYDYSKGVFYAYPMLTSNEDVDLDSLYGIIVGIDTPVVEFSDADSYTDGTDNILHIVYQKEISAIPDDEELPISPSWAVNIQNFVIGRCLITNQDTQNVQLGNYYISLFKNNIASIAAEDSMYNTIGDLTVGYNGIS